MPSTVIISELSQISKPVARIPFINPFTIPADYFQSLAGDILYRVTVTEPLAIDPSVTQFKNKNIPYQVPSGYFNSLSGYILDRIKASEIISPDEEIATLSSLLSSIDKKMPLSIPENYFQELTMPIVLGTGTNEKADDELLIPSFLQSVRTAPTYQLPPAYFSHLPGSILAKVKTTGKTKVISMTFTGKLARFAVAASVACVVAVSGWFYVQSKAVVKPLGTEMADIKNISSKELQEFADANTVILPEKTVVTSEDMNPEDIKVMLAGISDEELQQYVDQQPSLKDPGTINFN